MNELRVCLRGLPDAGPRSVDEVRVDGEDPVALDRRDDRPALSRCDVAGLRRVRVRGENDDLGVGLQDFLGGELRVRRRRARRDVGAAGDVDEVVYVRTWPDREDL